jgi:hypothetical protein
VRARVTHILSRIEEGQVRTQKKPSKRVALTSCRVHREGRVKTLKETNGARALTHCRVQREGQVSTLKETERVRGTHYLSSTEGGTSQETERSQVSEGHSHTVEGRERGKSGLGKTPNERGELTDCRAPRERRVRTPKETERTRGTHRLSSEREVQIKKPKKTEQVRGTHFLSSKERESQDRKETESKGHSHAVEQKGRDKSGP